MIQLQWNPVRGHSSSKKTRRRIQYNSRHGVGERVASPRIDSSIGGYRLERECVREVFREFLQPAHHPPQLGPRRPAFNRLRSRLSAPSRSSPSTNQLRWLLIPSFPHHCNVHIVPFPPLDLLVPTYVSRFTRESPFCVWSLAPRCCTQ